MGVVRLPNPASTPMSTGSPHWRALRRQVDSGLWQTLAGNRRSSERRDHRSVRLQPTAPSPEASGCMRTERGQATD